MYFATRHTLFAVFWLNFSILSTHVYPLAVHGSKNQGGCFKVWFLIDLNVDNTVLATQIEYLSIDPQYFNTWTNFGFFKVFATHLCSPWQCDLHLWCLMLYDVSSLRQLALGGSYSTVLGAFFLNSNTARLVIAGFAVELNTTAAFTTKILWNNIITYFQAERWQSCMHSATIRGMMTTIGSLQTILQKLND